MAMSRPQRWRWLKARRKTANGQPPPLMKRTNDGTVCSTEHEAASMQSCLVVCVCCQVVSGTIQEPYKVVDQMFDFIRSQSSMQAMGMASSSVIRDRRESVGNARGGRIERIDELGSSLSLLNNAAVRKQLDAVLTWKFDIIAVEEICKMQYAQGGSKAGERR